jgi:AraC family transcriptional regulator, arabinose operon regulatory protein
MDGAGDGMDYPTGMSDPRPVTPSVSAAPLACSEFRRGQGYTNWRPRGSGDWLLIFTLGGAGRVVAGGAAHRLEPGDAVLFAPGTEQDYSTEAEPGWWRLRWAHFQPWPHWRPWLLWPRLSAGVGHVRLGGSEAAAVGDALLRMLVAQRLGGTVGTELAMNALAEALIRSARAPGAAERPRVDARVQAAVEYLAAHVARPFRLDELARHCGLSASRLAHLFRVELGTSPQRFGEKLRLENARQLLAQTNLTVAEVAGEVGFADPLYFSRRFRRAFGRAPSAARAGLPLPQRGRKPKS